MKHLISGSRSSQCSAFSFFFAAAHGWYGISLPSTTPSPAGTPPTAPSARTEGAEVDAGGSHEAGSAGCAAAPASSARAGRAGMGLDVVVGGVERLPDAVQIRRAIRGARR